MAGEEPPSNCRLADAVEPGEEPARKLVLPLIIRIVAIILLVTTIILLVMMMTIRIMLVLALPNNNKNSDNNRILTITTKLIHKC